MPTIPSSYADIAKQIGEQSRLSSHAQALSISGTPQAEADTLRLSEVTGAPKEAVNLDPEHFRQQERIARWSKLGTESPTVAEWVRLNKVETLVQDDIEPMGAIGKLWQRYTDTTLRAPAEGLLGQAFGSGFKGLGELSEIAGRRGRQTNVPSLSPAFGAFDSIAKLYGTSSRELIGNYAESVGRILEDTGRDLGVPEDRQNFATEIGSAIGQIIGYAAVSIPSGGAGGLLLGAGQGADMQSDRIEKKEDVSEGEADTAKIGGAVVTAITEKLGFAWLMRKLPKNVQTQLTKRIGDIAMSAGGEAAQEVAEGILHNAIAKILYDPEADIAPLGDLAKEAGVAATAAGIFRAILGIKRGRTSDQQGETEGKANLDALVAEAGKVNFRNLTPGKFKQFLESLGEGAVYLPADKVAELYQEMPETEVAKLLNIPLDDYLTALATKSDVTVPLSHYASNLLEQHEELKPFVRVKRDSILDEEDDAELNQKALKVAGTFVDETDNRIFSDVVDMLTKTGKFGQTDVEGYAKLMQSAFRAMSKTEGLDAFDLYSQYRLKISAELPAALQSPGVVASLDSLIDEIKTSDLELKEGATDAQMQRNAQAKQLRDELDHRQVDYRNMTAADVRRAVLGDATVAVTSLTQDTDQSPETLEQEKRGALRFLPGGKFEIALFEKADASTFIHESGHFFLEVMKDLATKESASDKIKADYATLLKWFGSKGDVSVKNHEQFARGFEAFLFEGKSPSPELASVFQRFSMWLKAIYRSLSNLNVTLTDEVRDVMGRMLATEEEIASTRETLSLVPLFSESKAMGWSEDRFNSYIQAVKDAEQDEEARLLNRAMKEVTRTKLAWWKDQSASVEKDVTKEVEARPIYKALAYLQGAKLDKAWLLGRYGQEFLNKNLLRKKVYSVQGGMDPDLVADMFGFDSGDALVNEIINARSIDAVIKHETKQRMEAEHGNVLTDGKMLQEAAKALHGNKRIGVLHAELDALAKLSEQPAMTLKEVRLAAQMIVSGQRVRDLNPFALLRAERKAAREAIKFAGKQEWAKAFEAKRRQILNAHLYDESLSAVEEVETIKAFAKRIDRKASQERLGKAGLLDQVHSLLHAYSFRKDSLKRLDAFSKAKAQIIAALKAGEYSGSPKMLARLERLATVTNYRDAQVEELRGLHDTLKQLDKLGRDQYRAIIGQETIDLDVEADEIASSILSTQGIVNIPRGQETDSEASERFFGELVNSWRRPGSIARILDGQEWGPITRKIINRIRIAIVEGLEPRLIKSREAIVAVYEKYYSEKDMVDMGKRVFVSEINTSLSKFDMLALAQHWGNEENRKAVIDGQIMGLPDMSGTQVLALFEKHLTAKDWAFVQDTLDYMNTFWPEAEAAMKRRRGVSAPKVEANPFIVRTSDGKRITVQGGYAPLRYESRLESDEGKRKGDTVDEQFAKIVTGQSVASTTKYGHTIERVGSGKRPVRLDINGWHQHVSEVIRDIELTDTVVAVEKLLRHKSVEGAFKTTGNAETLKALRLWLKDVAVGELSPHGWEKVVSFARRNLTVAALSFNVWTAMIQTTGVFQSSAVLGKRNFARSVTVYGRNPKAAIQTAMSKSKFMSLRYELNAFHKDIQYFFEKAGEISNDNSAGWKDSLINTFNKLQMPPRLAWWGFMGIRAMQLQVDTVTWHAGYNKGIRNHLSEPDAIHYADAAVENTQTSGLFSERSGVERGTVDDRIRQSELLRALTMFGGPLIAKGNIASEIIKGTKATPANLAKTTLDLMLLFFPEVLFFAVVKGGWPDDDEDWAWWGAKRVAEQVASTVPIIREIPAATKGYGGGGIIGTLAGSPADVLTQIDQGEADKTLAKTVVRMFGLMFGYPSVLINRIIDAVDEEDLSIVAVGKTK